jgi:hypothetical protein
MMKNYIQTLPQYQVCVCVKEPLNRLLTESIPPFRVNPPLDWPRVLTNRIWAHDTRDLVRKPDELLEDGLSSVLVWNTFKIEIPIVSQSGSVFPTSFRYVQQYTSTEDKRIGSSRTRKLRGKNLKKTGKTLFFPGTRGEERRGWETVVMSPKQTKWVKGTVGQGVSGKKAKVNQHARGQSVSEKSLATRTSKNVLR